MADSQPAEKVGQLDGHLFLAGDGGMEAGARVGSHVHHLVVFQQMDLFVAGVGAVPREDVPDVVVKVVCYTLCRRCRENAIAAGEGKGI